MPVINVKKESIDSKQPQFNLQKNPYLTKLDLRSKSRKILSTTINKYESPNRVTDNDVTMSIESKVRNSESKTKETENTYYTLPASLERYVQLPSKLCKHE